MTARPCEWGECEGAAVETVSYPAVVPGTAGRQRCWRVGTEALHVCAECAEAARAEVAAEYSPPGDCLCGRHETETDE